MGAPGFDWSECLALAQVERVAGLLYAALRHQPWVPDWLIDALRREYVAQGSRNTLLLQELAQALAQLKLAGIPVIALKGVALLAHVYRSIGLRPMVDLDLLMRKEDILAATACLAALGYRAAHAEPAEGLALSFENEVLLTRTDRIQLAVELHWSLFDSPYYQHRLPMAWFWETAIEAQVGSTTVRILGPGAELLYLCGHLALHHQGHGLLWQYDLAALVAVGAGTLNWDALLARAQQMDLLLPLQTLLPVLARDWAAPVPPVVLERLAGLQPTFQEARVFSLLTAAQRPVLHRLGADLASIPTWRDRLCYAWCNLFPSADYMRQRYAIRHRALLLLYYPYRWVLGLGEMCCRR